MRKGSSFFQTGILAATIAVFSMLLIAPAQGAKESETWLGLPVGFSSRDFAFKPWPAMELKQLKVQTAEPIEFGKSWVFPDYGEWIIRRDTSRLRMDTDQITARPSSLARLGAIDGISTRIITRMNFSRLSLKLGTQTLEIPAGIAEFSDEGTLTHIRVKLAEGASITLTPKIGKLGILVQAESLKWQALSAFKFDGVVAQGEVNDDGVVLDKIGATGDGGSMSGALRLGAAGKFTLDGELSLLNLRARDLLARLFPRHTVEGTLSAKFKLSASGDTFESLGSTFSVSGSYSLLNGTIDRFGLLEGLRKSGSGTAGGGMVRFDHIAGRFSGSKDKPASVNFQGLDAGALQASGSISVTPEGVLSGSINGSLKAPGGEMTSRTLKLTGRVETPSLIVAE